MSFKVIMQSTLEYEGNMTRYNEIHHITDILTPLRVLKLLRFHIQLQDLVAHYFSAIVE